MEETESSIYRWLSRVTEGEQAPSAFGAGAWSRAPYLCPSLAGLAGNSDGPDHPLKSFSAVLQSTESAPQSQVLQSQKRTRDTPIREEPPRDEPRPAKPLSEYERKPRHKTRTGRYEYKTTTSLARNLAEFPEQKAKRQRWSRKQSMNERFRATNVARNRLTLTNTANLGIFSRGRASSPFKHRDVPNLALSETNLLSRKTPSNGRVSMSAFKEPKKQKPTSHVYDSLNFQSRDAPNQRDVYLKNAFPQNPAQYVRRFERIAAASSRNSLSPNKITDLADPRKLRIAAPDQKPLDSQAVEIAHRSRRATSYTWSESRRATVSMDGIAEDHLLNILHVGLVPMAQAGPKVNVDSKYYYSLHDLEILLEARKKSWHMNDTGVEAIFQPASTFNPQLQPVTQTPAIEEETEISGHKLNNALVERNTTPETGETCEGDALWGSQLQVDFNGDLISNPPLLWSQRVEYPHMTDADAFFGALDAEFCAIMETSNNYLEPARQSSKPQPTLEVDQNAENSLRKNINSFDDSEINHRFERSGSGSTYSASHMIPAYLAQVELETPPIDRRILPVIHMNNGYIKNSLNKASENSSGQSLSVPRTTSALKHATLPSGFWRQNKLY